MARVQVPQDHPFVLDVLEKARQRTEQIGSKKKAAELAGIEESRFGQVIRHGGCSLDSLEKLAAFIDIPTEETNRFLDILRWTNRTPCVTCGQPFASFAHYKRCRKCRKDEGKRPRKTPKNPLASYLAIQLAERKMSWAQFSAASGMCREYLHAGAGLGPSWHPQLSALEGMARVLGQDIQILINIAGGTHEDGLRKRVFGMMALRFAKEADRARTGEAHYEPLVRQAIESRNSVRLQGLTDELRLTPRLISPKALTSIRRRAEQLRGKRKPQDFRDKMRRRWHRLPEGRKARQIQQGTAQLALLTDAQKIAKTIRSIATRNGIDYVLKNMGRYAEWVTDRFKLDPSVAEMQIRKALRLKGYGRRPQYDHPGICERRRLRETWPNIAIDRDQWNNVRVAHRQWHRNNNVPSCSPYL